MSRNFQNYITACAGSVGDEGIIPEVFRKWAAISSIAGALGRKVWYDFGQFQLKPNLYIMLIAPPGRGKSVSLILPIYTVYGRLAVEPMLQPADYPPHLDTYDMKDKPLFLLQDKITPEDLIRQMKKTGRINFDLTKGDQFFHESPLTLVTSEFGSLMNRNDKTLQMFLTDMWDAKERYTYHTKNSGHDLIEGPCLNWIACATPEQFIENMPENARSQGLLPRMIPVLYDGQRSEDKLFYGEINRSTAEYLVRDLAEISQIQGEYRFEDSFREEVSEYVRAGMEPRPTDPNLSEYNERRLPHWIKVAMCVSAACGNNRLITREHWDFTRDLMLAAEEKMPEVLKSFGVRNAGRVALDVLEFIKVSSQMKGRTLMIKEVKREIMRKVTNAAEIDTTYKQMIEAEMIAEVGKRVVLVDGKKAVA